MNSIEQKRKSTIQEVQFDKTLQETKNQIEQINKGIDVKKHLGENTYCHYTYDKKYYVDEVIKYFEGKGYKVQRLPSECAVSYKINIIWSKITITQETVMFTQLPEEHKRSSVFGR